MGALLAVPVIFSSLVHHSLPHPFVQLFGPVWSRFYWSGWIVRILLALCPPYSPASLLQPFQYVACRWPKLLTKKRLALLPPWLIGVSGPFGFGCGKGCEFFCSWILLAVWDKQLWPHGLRLGPPPSLIALGAVILISVGVNIVLMLWSRVSGQNGDHDGVDKMVDAYRHRSLSISEHADLIGLAIGNAVFEEGVSRGFFMHELTARCQLSANMANFWQAVAFGLWHYHGIPSGIAGVLLTFVYGGLMGLLHQQGEGMWLPCIAHSLADYFIFAYIARQERG